MTTVQREPGTIIRDRYVLTAVAEAADAEGGPDPAPVWRAVDMVLRRPVIVVFDPPAPVDERDGTEAQAEAETGTGPDGAAAGALGRIDPEPPTGVPVGEILDGGNHLGDFYRVFRTPGDTTPIDPTPFASTGDADPDVTVVAPLFGAIDGADATRPMGLPAPGAWPQPPLAAGFDQPVDPTIELPTPGAPPWAAALAPMAPIEPADTAAALSGAGASSPSGPFDPVAGGAYPDPPPPPPPAPPAPRRSGPHPVPLSVAAASVLCVLGVGGYLLARQPRSVATTIGPPPAAAQAAPRETVPTTVEETTTTETLPETTTTVETTTWARPTTTRPPVTEPPETEPPPTEPPTTTTTIRVRPTIIQPPTTNTRRPTTTWGGQFEVNTVGDDPMDLATGP
jgi:hypothetical protein